MTNHKHFFITATGTGIGKTYVTAKLCKHLRQMQQKVSALKPVISGFAADDHTNDTAIILESLGLEYNEENINKVSPFRFNEPLSPDIAARMEGRHINFKELVAVCSQEIKVNQDNYLFIEGVGGVMVPLNDKDTVIDLIAELNLPVILLAGNYLGTISHTLTAYLALRSVNANIHAIVINEINEPGCTINELIHSISNFILPKTKLMTLNNYNLVEILK